MRPSSWSHEKLIFMKQIFENDRNPHQYFFRNFFIFLFQITYGSWFDVFHGKYNALLILPLTTSPNALFLYWNLLILIQKHHWKSTILTKWNLVIYYFCEWKRPRKSTELRSESTKSIFLNPCSFANSFFLKCNSRTKLKNALIEPSAS